ncbi:MULTISPECIES: flagellar protein FliT [Paenibacillus]|uniref:Flagellar protein FliT n=1 Tax=Paenibacillus alvei TaxID=44250 RepID=A0ABT4E4X9_PAEAL|nr:MULTISPECIES: flagellar protein FliT [Paenibacillus]EPY09489.1 hypothetical protein PAAL66ix_25913 [Paenibacillus alvei A6-6i-x]MCY9528640.1 flagellar protein FliT [Paenibacillus alvei]SDG23453.1 hypothetical protein SAMN04488689_11167 [Paenibacillus sp. cl6col]
MAGSDQVGKAVMIQSGSLIDLAHKLLEITQQYFYTIQSGSDDWYQQLEDYEFSQKHIVKGILAISNEPLPLGVKDQAQNIFKKCYDLELQIKDLLELHHQEVAKNINNLQQGNRLKKQYDLFSPYEAGSLFDTFK